MVVGRETTPLHVNLFEDLEFINSMNNVLLMMMRMMMKLELGSDYFEGQC